MLVFISCSFISGVSNIKSVRRRTIAGRGIGRILKEKLLVFELGHAH